MRAVIDFPDTAPQAVSGGRLRASFDQPIEVVEAWSLADVLEAVERVQAHAEAGRWCVGGLAYEAAPAFDASLPVLAPDPRWPLVWFGVYEAPLTTPLPLSDRPRAARWTLPESRAHYLAQVERAQQAMAAGDCYQINLTTALAGTLTGEPSAWMQALRARQPEGYLLWLDGAHRHVLSASPELFFDWQPDAQGSRLQCRPMKGTAGREGDPVLDAAARERLLASAKERAENVMIVDLLRNDLNRIARPGSVRVDRLMEAEAWPSVWQMTSSLSAQARGGTTLTDVFRALFPCGSITGAPKRQAMRWITRLESGHRGFYCGALGVVRPGGHATFNVPIRTLALHHDPVTPPAWQARYGVGSGLTVYADPASEWDELMTKSHLLHRASEPFSLLETLRLEDGEYWLLERHLQRLQDSARHFGYPCDPSVLRERLSRQAEGHAKDLWRVRLTVDAQGAIDVQAFPMADTAQPVRVALAPAPLPTGGELQEFIRYKTTRRAHYEALAPTDPAVFDHLLVNERGEITEFTRGNVAIRLDGVWLTPALSSGLLAGTYRAALLVEERLGEAVLTTGDLARAQGLAFFNGLRGWLDAVLVPGADAPPESANAPRGA
ncbi:chorismate-binding protein [Hydrogenophaga aromaticivorans]|uniref:chorismate-binding protein n=1 Tax=Hydrogenophaga aromaticivorans TaxID=2610898 RepID=UPI001B392898|nr:chorismate-binding protein [Hydrogenophaga aromaticivorans]MBQ0920924.1 chorismate-binding protein [Hydrogenophaga aromaticivorans]